LKYRKQLLLERIERLIDEIILKQYHLHVNHNGSSTVKSTTLIDFGEQNRESGMKWTEMASGKRKALYMNDSKWYQTPVIKNCYEGGKRQIYP
jgi:DNA-binding Lrp family transcriptional regulator